MQPRTQALAGAGLLALAAMPPARHLLEGSMFLHMLVQVPLLVLAGALLGARLPARAGAALQSFNAHGLAGWTLGSLVLAFWMLPLALDAAVADVLIDAAKFASLLFAGLAIRLSTAVPGAIVPLFFIGNWAWMTATIGLLYTQTPERLCNAYLVGDQAASGYGLVLLAVLAPALWLAYSPRSPSEPPRPSAAPPAAAPPPMPPPPAPPEPPR